MTFNSVLLPNLREAMDAVAAIDSTTARLLQAVVEALPSHTIAQINTNLAETERN